MIILVIFLKEFPLSWIVYFELSLTELSYWVGLTIGTGTGTWVTIGTGAITGAAKTGAGAIRGAAAITGAKGAGAMIGADKIG